jgi:hypothetical protein
VRKMAQRQAGTSASDAMDTDGEHHCVITPLGAGQEVGRSCIILKYRCGFALALRLPEPCTMVLCGGSGGLSRRSSDVPDITDRM